MSYQVLARKWRPQCFETLKGQDHVVTALMNALNQQRLHHAYLFSGTRGVGKTTIARIISKCLNCESGITATPCGTCSTCREIDEGRFIDLIEVDAASRTKVEDTRELLDNVQYKPTRGRFKIYLIDEVHMLSGHSFNALLKTLEEPPPHVKFLLATTDPQKLPITVLSRCLQFNLKNLSAETIAHYLAYVLDEEKISYEAPALQLLAHAANGSMRDALSLLDQAIAYTQNAVHESSVMSMLGTVDRSFIAAIINSLANHDGEKLLNLSAQLSEQGLDYAQVLDDLLGAFHQMAVLQCIPPISSHDSSLVQTVKAATDLFSPEEIQLFYQICLIGRRDLDICRDKKTGFEMTLLRLLAFQPMKQNPSQQKILCEKKEETKQKTAIKIDKKPMEAPVIKTMEWSQLVEQLNLAGMTQALATHCCLASSSDKSFNLVLPSKHAALLNENVKQRLNQAMNDYFSSSIQLNITIGDTPKESPAEKNLREKKEKHEAAVQTMKDDGHIKNLMETFNATLEPDLIQSIDAL